MNVTLTSPQIKSEQNDNNVLENGGEDDDMENDRKSNVDLEIEQQEMDAGDDEEDEKDYPKVQSNGTITKTQNLKKSDKIFTSSNLEDSPKSWKHCDNAFVDEDMCTMVSASQTLPNFSLQITSIDGFFNRKRGRPPKNRFVEVYKNTHQKPQAIFTSFKLEKHGKPDATSNYDNSINSDGVYNANEYSRYKSVPNSTYRKRLSKVNSMISSEISCLKDDTVFYKHRKDGTGSFEQNNINKSSEKYNLKNVAIGFETSNSAANTDYDDNDLHTMSFDSLPAIKKQKIYETVDHVTVVRAAGTFYPENSNENSAAANKAKEKLADLNNEQQSGTFLKNEVQFSSSTNYEVAQNLSLKDMGTTCKDSLESPGSFSASSSVLPQIYNVLQMQQQLFAFYHQMALMTPAFLHLDLNYFIFPNSVATGKTTSANTFSATSSDTSSIVDFSAPNRDLLNMILNLKKHQSNRKNSNCELINSTRSGGRVRPSLKKISSSTTIFPATTKNFNIFEDTSAAEPAHKLPDSQVASGKEKTPSGYLRFGFNEDCGYTKCGYRQHQSHFHCNRTDCQYSFCDKTRFFQHTARHERLDTLMGSDFQQYRATMTCNYSNCPYTFDTMSDDSNDILNGRKSSHFHCLKCQFVCSDTNKVVAHRRLHDKMEFIRLAGFRRVTSTENCMISSSEKSDYVRKMNNVNSELELSDSDKCLATNFDTDSHCPYAMRHAHYHCLICNGSVLSRSQLLAHKHRSTDTISKTQSPETANIFVDNLNNKKK